MDCLGNAVKKVFEDLEGNIWIATYGDGTEPAYQANPWFSPNMETAGLDNDIQAVAVTDDNQYILWRTRAAFSGLIRKRIKSPVKSYRVFRQIK